MTSLSAINFPTTTAFIDDEISFLNQLTAAIDCENYKICQDFGELQKILKEQPQVRSMADISALACNPKRHEFISTVVIDYQMPSENGLELCKKIKDSPVIKIMLTGIASKDEGIEAHNDDLIDFFISKNDPQFSEKLKEAIVAGKRKYFTRLSNRIRDFYIADNPLADPTCAAYLENELKDVASYHAWIDFHRISAVTRSNKHLDYMLCSDDDYFALLNSEEADDAPKEIVEKLNDRVCMLWYENTIPPGKEWGSYISDCTKIGDSSFYIAKARF